MKAIFYDRNAKLHRCHFAGIIENGQPEWLLVEQGLKTITLSECEKEAGKNPYYRLLCVEGEQPRTQILLQIIGSFLKTDIEEDEPIFRNVEDFLDDLDKHQVSWEKKGIRLVFHVNPMWVEEGKYSLCVELGFGGREPLVYVNRIEDLDDMMEKIDDFCCQLEDSFHYEVEYKSLNINKEIDHEFDRVYLDMFDAVYRN